MFCRTREILDPCVKLWGPKKEALEPSRPVSMYDQSIDPKEVMLLQYTYSEVFWEQDANVWDTKPVRQLLRLFSSVYGASIIHLPLRHAMLSYASLDRDLVADHLEYDLCANRELQRKLANPDTLDEGDLFVSFLLAVCEKVKSNTIAPYVNGILGIMDVLFHRAGGNIKLYELSVCWPLLRDIFAIYLTDTAYVDRYLHILETSHFNQVKAYTEALTGVAWMEEPSWHYAMLQSVAVHHEGRYLRRLLRSQIINQSGEEDSTDNSTSIPASFSVMAKELNLDFSHKALRSFLNLTRRPVSALSDDEMKTILSVTDRAWSIATLSVRARFNSLFRAILGAPTIAEGLSSDETIREVPVIIKILSDFGGVALLEPSWTLGEGSMAPLDDILYYWNCLGSAATEMFWQGTGPQASP